MNDIVQAMEAFLPVTITAICLHGEMTTGCDPVASGDNSAPLYTLPRVHKRV